MIEAYINPAYYMFLQGSWKNRIFFHQGFVNLMLKCNLLVHSNIFQNCDIFVVTETLPDEKLAFCSSDQRDINENDLKTVNNLSTQVSENIIRFIADKNPTSDEGFSYINLFLEKYPHTIRQCKRCFDDFDIDKEDVDKIKEHYHILSEEEVKDIMRKTYFETTFQKCFVKIKLDKKTFANIKIRNEDFFVSNEVMDFMKVKYDV